MKYLITLIMCLIPLNATSQEVRYYEKVDQKTVESAQEQVWVNGVCPIGTVVPEAQEGWLPQDEPVEEEGIIRRPFRPKPNQPVEGPEFDRDEVRYPALNRLFGIFKKIPLIRDITNLIVDFSTLFILIGLWLVPVYVFKWRLIWPWDLLLNALSRTNDLKPPFQK